MIPPTLFKNTIDTLVIILLQPIGTDLESKKEPVIHSTLDSEINVAPGITVAQPLKNFHITILILFFTSI